MTDDSRPRELRATPDPLSAPPVPDGDRVRREPPPNIDPPTTRQKWITALVLLIVFAAILIRHLR